MIHNLTKQKIDNNLSDKINRKFPNEENIYISYGWIDSHVHLYSKSVYHLSPNHFTDLKGVVGVIDAGSSGVDNFLEAYEENKRNDFKTFYLLNASSKGIDKYQEIEKAKIDLTKYQSLQLQYPEIIGLKLRYSSQAINKNIDYEIMLKTLSKTDIKTMFHIGNEPPLFKTLMKYIGKHDIVTHFSHGKNNNVIIHHKDLKKKEIYFDVGMGNESFSLEMFFNLLSKGIYPTSLSTDLHNKTSKNDSARLYKLIELMLETDLDIKDIINMVTLNPYHNYLNKNFQDYLQTKTIFSISKSNDNYFKDSKNNKMKLQYKVKILGLINERGVRWY